MESNPSTLQGTIGKEEDVKKAGNKQRRADGTRKELKGLTIRREKEKLLFLSGTR